MINIFFIKNINNYDLSSIIFYDKRNTFLVIIKKLQNNRLKFSISRGHMREG